MLIRRQMTCCTPWTVPGPYFQVARPLPSQVSSKTPGGLRMPPREGGQGTPAAGAQVVDDGRHGLAKAAALGGGEVVQVDGAAGAAS